jgi:hypothetical protein
VVQHLPKASHDAEHYREAEVTAFAAGTLDWRAGEERSSAIVQRVNAEVITVTRSGESHEVSAHVRLSFKLTDQIAVGEREIVTCIRLIQKDDFHWKRTKRRIVQRAWEWLQDYFEGADFGDDCHNLFDDTCLARATRNQYGLTLEQEQSLQRELISIEQDYVD